MNIAILGAGGVTTPLVVGSLLRRANQMEIERIVLVEPAEDRLRFVSDLVARVSASSPSVRIELARRTPTVRCPADQLDVAIVSIRPGLEEGRVADELRAKRLGFLANETVGPAGLSFACRAIPAACAAADDVLQQSPECLVINFTNPAGIVTAGLHEAGVKAAYGVCSSSEKSMRLLRNTAASSKSTWECRVFGLNHLSWTYSLVRDGREVLQDVLRCPEQLGVAQPWFDPRVPLAHEALANEYLYYYEATEHAMELQASSSQTRAEDVAQMNKVLREGHVAAVTADSAYRQYIHYVATRKRSHMAGALREGTSSDSAEVHDDDGYAGSAIGLIEALVLGESRTTTAIRPGHPTDLVSKQVAVESSMTIERKVATGLMPPSLADIPTSLIRAVGLYEDAARRAILEKRGDELVAALALHPLAQDEDANAAFVRATFAEERHIFKNWVAP